MENAKKQDFCIGAVFLVLQALSLGKSEWFTGLLLIAISVFLFMKKQDIVLAILAGVYALLNFFTIIRIIEYASFVNTLYYLLTAGAWALIALITLTRCGKIPSLAEQLPLLGKIFFAVAILATVMNVIRHPYNNLLDYIYDLIGYDFYSMYRGETVIILIFCSVFALLHGIGLILVGMWCLSSQKKTTDASADGDAVSIGVSSEFYVSMGKHICLMLFTFGIWLMIWVYRTTKFCNNAKGEEPKDPTTSLLLYLFIPFYSLYWTYKMAQRIDKIAKDKGIASDIGTICLILAIFVGIVPPILMQDKINSLITTDKVPATAVHNEVENLEKYKELLDKGIITQEEFDAKKNQLLGL